MSVGNRDHAIAFSGVNTRIPPACSPDHASAAGAYPKVSYLRAYSAARRSPISPTIGVDGADVPSTMVTVVPLSRCGAHAGLSARFRAWRGRGGPASQHLPWRH